MIPHIASFAPSKLNIVPDSLYDLFLFSFIDKAHGCATIPGLYRGKPGTSLVSRRFPAEPKCKAQVSRMSPGGLRGGAGGTETRAERMARLGREKAQKDAKNDQAAAKKDQTPSNERPLFIPKQGLYKH